VEDGDPDTRTGTVTYMGARYLRFRGFSMNRLGGREGVRGSPCLMIPGHLYHHQVIHICKIY
jgi:hypothetical protein